MIDVDHPVIAAIDAEHERLQLARLELTAELANFDRELEALERGRALISESASASPSGAVEAKDDDPAPADPPRKPKRGRSSKGSAKPARSPAPKDRSADRAEILRVLKLIGEPCSRGQILGSCNLSGEPFKQAMAQLVESGEVVRTGVKAGTRYSLPGKAAAPPAPAEERTPVDPGPGDRLVPSNANRNGTLDGRILKALLTSRPTTTELELALGVQRKDLDMALSRLMRDGDVKVTTEGYKRVLVGVP